jgi:GNAT superfamily N-acetyltransferase
MVDSGRRFWLADEFCSTLDRTTARVVAYNMQKMARRTGSTLVVATTHTDLEEDLNPSIVIRKGWGEEIDVDYRPNVEASGCTAVEDVVIREATREDYHRLSYLHYREQRLPVTLRIYAMERGSELIGVIVYGSPPPQTAGRRQAVGYSPNIEEINRDWAVVSRVIIHPKYRTTGLGARLVRDTLPKIGRRHVELVAVMAQYNPFAEHAGMKLIRKSEPSDEVTEAMGRLQKLGFNIMMMASDSYNSRKLQEMTDNQIDEVREILVCVGQYKRLASWSKPYGRKAEFRDWLRTQPPERLTRCLAILSVLSEAKAYLYWCRDWMVGDVSKSV